ncbi:Plasmodium exported protein, unknown function [Plasmodium vivax]|uniref:Plasmodium RESA N-terminal domain-containing protein n=2 Tax=Plasmodium vivax TaxID=5855 RepID=A5KCS7_PLAVS|nr:hypothetical protein PVX_125735 [Plasmodium vivax]EDL42844.1 hypothetical protein PVX_125735 [Plasmodium vivax]KMZ87512.1 hypothetical protein PVBG_04850 [Plasmodium vivax Brazil I]CAI7719465.1 Plasmodium exported protein, unknown function [Plasmodium vivax]|eukprot:XP_001612618.1 hypothetical protein [Plasmodium vivax Sal-1]
MKNENHNEINIKGIDKAKCDKSDESRTTEFATVRIIKWTSQIRVNVFPFILKVIILTFFLHISKRFSNSSPFTPGNNSNNERHNARFKTLRVLNGSGTSDSTSKYKSLLSITKKKSDKSEYSEKKTETTKSTITSYKDLKDEVDEADLSDEGVLLGEMNKIILQEKLMREEFSKAGNSPSNAYFALYFNDENCINRIMDLSRKSRLYRSKYLRLRYRILRHINKFIKRMKVFFIMEYKYNRNFLEEFRASNFYYFVFPYVKCHIKIFFSRFSK